MVNPEIVEREVIIPDEVTLELKGRTITVKGPLGEIKEDFSHLPLRFLKEKKGILVRAIWPKKKESSLVGTAASLIINMIKGVTTGFHKKLKVVYSHFPVTVTVDKDNRKIIISNFLGERNPRIAYIHGNVDIEVSGENLIVKGIRLEDVSQTAANIELATKIKDKDQRVFLDGIYVYERQEGIEE